MSNFVAGTFCYASSGKLFTSDSIDRACLMKSAKKAFSFNICAQAKEIDIEQQLKMPILNCP